MKPLPLCLYHSKITLRIQLFTAWKFYKYWNCCVTVLLWIIHVCVQAVTRWHFTSMHHSANSVCQYYLQLYQACQCQCFLKIIYVFNCVVDLPWCIQVYLVFGAPNHTICHWETSEQIITSMSQPTLLKVQSWIGLLMTHYMLHFKPGS